MDADGALHRRGELAGRQHRQAPRRAGAATASPTWPAGADGVHVLPVAGLPVGAEKFHSAMLPHAGTGTRIWREVLDLGDDLNKLSRRQGLHESGHGVAILWDVESWWAQDLEWRPSSDLDHRERIEAYYSVAVEPRDHRRLRPSGSRPVRLRPGPRACPLSDRREGAPRTCGEYVDGGGHLLVSYFSGIVDGNDTVPAGASPGALRDILGLEIQEFLPLREQETVSLSGGSGSGTVWAEDIHVGSATVVSRYVDGPAASGPAITRNAFGRGTAWYVSTKLDDGDLAAVVLDAAGAAGIATAPQPPQGLEVITRSTPTDHFTFLINHSDADAEYPASGTDLLTGAAFEHTAVVPGGTVSVIHAPEGNS